MLPWLLKLPRGLYMGYLRVVNVLKNYLYRLSKNVQKNVPKGCLSYLMVT
jgi:hypothetical protein